MKKFISLALALILVFSLGVSSFAAPIVKKVQQVEKTETDKQLDFIFENLADLSQDSADGQWSYTVTDLDHNGTLELIAAICKAPEYYTYAKIFEVSPERDAFIECDMSVEEGKPFIDILQDSADTYYDKANDTWYYLFSEDFTQSTSEHYAVKCSVSLKDGYVTPASYATEHCEVINGITAVTYEDMNGNLITPDEFNNAGASAFKGFEKSGTNFSWFSLKDAKTISVLSDSYKVFTGDKEVINSNKTTNNSSKGKKSGSFLMITKNPTSEYCSAGDTVYFVTSADNASSYTWSFTSPAGDRYSANEFKSYFSSSSLSGINSPTLTIWNVAENMNGWGAYCECTGNGQTARSSTAYVYVSAKPAGYISGTVTDYLMSSVTIALSNGKSVQVLKDICNVSGGSLDYGCSCTCYYTGSTPTASSIYRVDVVGKQDPDNSTSGTYVASGTDGYAVAIYVPLAGTTLYVSPSIVNYIGNVYDGCPCTVNFRGYVPTGNSDGNIYSVTVYGNSGLLPEENFTWTCDLCYTRNTDNDYNCRSCGNPRYHTGLIIEDDYTWTCDLCYTQNTDNDYNCRSCGNPRYHTGLITDPEPVIAPAPYYEETGWNCSSCGTHNGEYDAYCSGCGMSRSGTGFIADVFAPEAYTDVFTSESYDSEDIF